MEDISKQSDNNSSDNEENNTEAESNTDEFLIGKVIDAFLHSVLDIEDCARDYISVASKSYNENSERLKNEITECQNILDSEEDHNKRLIGVRNLRKILREVDRHNNSSPVETLEKSLFINLFASFDKYVGDLVVVLYQKNPSLYKNINRELPLSEALKFETMEELRQAMLDKEIESLRRKSYAEQFKDLEAKFSIKLTKFKEWPYFIERAQRRNLFTHCDGIVSKQYLDICKSVGCQFENDHFVGEQLEIGAKYFFQSCALVAQVAVMLGQTLWRKTLPDDLSEADGHLSNLVFDFLHMEHWGNALSLSKFALDLPAISDDVYERIFHVNYAIALFSIGKKSAAKKILDKKDWSATTYDFKIAYAVLTEDYERAKELMGKIGKEGELITELSYHDWPLFREFRDTKEFFCGYEAVYGYKYSTKLSEMAEDKKSEVNNDTE